MKYTVCYAMYCSCEVEADDSDQAIELAVDPKSYKQMAEEVDDVEVTAIFDETGKQVIY